MNNVLKYPGSKWRISDRLIEMIPEHHTYIEPFFGSGAVFFKKTPSDIELINDMDDDVVNLFSCIQEDSEKLARLVMTTPYSRQMYEDCYAKVDDEQLSISLDKYHSACKFLIKCWQGHGFRTNGYQVGWKNDVQGRERMYSLWNWYRLPTWIIDIAERLRQVQIEHRPAIDVIKRFDYENVFMYLDPPYVLDTRSAKQYKHEMTDKDHKELLEIVIRSKAKIMLSGYASELYDCYLKDWQRVEINSLAEHGKQRTEVVWMNYETEHTTINEQLTLCFT